MGEAIPLSELAKMGVYDIELGEGLTVKTRVVALSNTLLINHFVSELKSSIPASGQGVIGVDVKYATTTSCFCMSRENGPSALLILSTETQCLIIQLCSNVFSPSADDFFKDGSLIFVGMKSKLVDFRYGLLRARRNGVCIFEIGCGLNRVVDIGSLAARVLKSPGLETCTKMQKLAREVGIPYGKIKKTGKWDARVFSHEQVKAAMTDAYIRAVLRHLSFSLCFEYYFLLLSI